jgi:uncharacterized membrane protein YfcA
VTRPVTKATPAPEVRRGRSWTWVALVAITVGVAVGAALDRDANPIVPGLFASVAALEMMLGWYWWRSHGRRGG